jgi:uncharacterized protein YndB with AHSA1/START domain
MSQRIVSTSRVIDATPEAIFTVLTDPTKHPIIDGSGYLESAKDNPDRLTLGAKFSMNMKMGVHYTTKNVVSVFEENRAIAWHHFAQFVWRYDLEPVEGGTRVTESFDYSKPWGLFLNLTKMPEANREGMVKSLENLEQYVTTGSVG